MIDNKYFKVIPNLLPDDDLRYIRWRNSLKRRPPPWSKGKTKYNDKSVMKISQTFKKRHIDNFANWRAKMKLEGKIKSSYPAFSKTKEFAYLFGLSLGDGNITVFPRTECLTIALNTKYPDLVNYAAGILEMVFDKVPSKNYQKNCVRLRIYQKLISKRMGFPTGNRKNSPIGIPAWVWKNNKFLIWALKGLFEAEGSLSIHLPTCTYNFQFSNRNPKLRNDVGKALERLGYHPEYHRVSTRLRRRDEVKSFQKLITFRESVFPGSTNGSVVAL